MRVEYLPSLPVLRDLYAQPRDMGRFKRYLAAMVGENEAGRPDVVLPITQANPMGREHCLAAVEALLAVDADAVAERAFREAAEAFPDVDHAIRASVVVLDDVGGGWTNRVLNEAAMRLATDERALRANAQRRFVLAPCWTSEAYAADDLVAEARAATYRYAHLARHGACVTLADVMRLDGAARAFAGAQPALPSAELDATAAALAPHRESTAYPVQVACLFGDAAAESVGYPPLGVGPYAGFELALAERLAEGGAG
jgi:hypothetical protein